MLCHNTFQRSLNTCRGIFGKLLLLNLQLPWACQKLLPPCPRTDDSDHKPVVQPVPGQAVVVRSWATKDQFRPSKACRWSKGCEHTTPSPQISFRPVADLDRDRASAQTAAWTQYDIVIQSILPDAMLLFTLDGSDVVSPHGAMAYTVSGTFVLQA